MWAIRANQKNSTIISKSPILVTGSHRSGSTWVGRTLAQAPGVGYIHEPFNIHTTKGTCAGDFKYWFTYISPENEAQFYDPVKATLEFRYNLAAALKTFRRLAAMYGLRATSGRLANEYRIFLLNRFYRARPIVKDPIAVFSAEWLASRFRMTPVVVVRHPAGFASSVKLLGWRHPFSHFLDQPLLMRDHLYPFEGEIREYAREEKDIIAQATLLWRVIHYVIMRYQKKHPDWIFVRHEDLSREPVRGFETLAKKLNLAFTDRVRAVIQDRSDSSNPGDPADGGRTWAGGAALKRNSKANIWNWKTRLTGLEIERIRMKVDDIANLFYSREEW